MHHSTTVLQYLYLRPNLTFSDPSTPDGKLWNAALKRISQTNGWSQLHWGSQLSVKDAVDLIITWQNHAALQSFIRDDYTIFLHSVSPLLSSDDKDGKLCQPAPYLINLHLGIPSLELGAVSLFYDLRFDEEVSDEVKTGLGIEIQLCRQFFMDAAKRVGQGDDFLGMDGCWMEEYGSAPIPPIPSSVSQSTTQDSIDDVKTRTKKFLVITDFSNQHFAKAIFNSGSILDPPLSASASTAGDYFTNHVLRKCSRWSQHEVVFENVSASNVGWLDKDEKWSVYVERLMAAEDAGRGKDNNG